MSKRHASTDARSILAGASTPASTASPATAKSPMPPMPPASAGAATGKWRWSTRPAGASMRPWVAGAPLATGRSTDWMRSGGCARHKRLSVCAPGACSSVWSHKTIHGRRRGAGSGSPTTRRAGRPPGRLRRWLGTMLDWANHGRANRCAAGLPDGLRCRDDSTTGERHGH